MEFFTNKCFLIVSKCGKLIAKGTPRDRFICHIDEDDNKRFLTYSSEGRAISAFKHSGFYLSEDSQKYILNTFPEKQRHTKANRLFWNDVEDLFTTKEYIVTYEAVIKMEDETND